MLRGSGEPYKTMCYPPTRCSLWIPWSFIYFLFILFISLTVGASRLIEAQMDLPHLLFGVGFQIFFL